MNSKTAINEGGTKVFRYFLFILILLRFAKYLLGFVEHVPHKRGNQPNALDSGGTRLRLAWRASFHAVIVLIANRLQIVFPFSVGVTAI